MNSIRHDRIPQMEFEKFSITVRKQKEVVDDMPIVLELDNSSDNSARYYNKNAFRYICRIALKEGTTTDYRQIVTSIANKHQIPLSDLLSVLSKAQAVSGPRYFQQMLEEVSRETAQASIDYLTWFLRKRYFRYLDKSKCSKKKPSNPQEYLKYKNRVMIPLLSNMLQNL